MNTNTNKNLEEVTEKKETLAKNPDEFPLLHIEAKVRIFDPETNKTVFEGRA